MRCSSGQFREFEKSFIWKDILDELDVWLEQIRDELEGAEGHILYRLQGNAESVRNCKNILNTLITVAGIKEGDDEGGN